MKRLYIAAIFLLIASSNGLCKDIFGITHPFISAFIRLNYPDLEIEFVNLYSRGHSHGGFHLKPSDYEKLKVASAIFTAEEGRQINELAIKSKIQIINIADCNIIEDKLCEHDKHFWLSNDAFRQVQESLYRHLVNIDKKYQLNNSWIKFLSSEGSKINECKSDTFYTSHSFEQRLSLMNKMKFGGYIFDRNGGTRNKIIEKIRIEGGCIIIEHGMGMDAIKKLRSLHQSVSIIELDVEGIKFEKEKDHHP